MRYITVRLELCMQTCDTICIVSYVTFYTNHIFNVLGDHIWDSKYCGFNLSQPFYNCNIVNLFWNKSSLPHQHIWSVNHFHHGTHSDFCAHFISCRENMVCTTLMLLVSVPTFNLYWIKPNTVLTIKVFLESLLIFYAIFLFIYINISFVILSLATPTYWPHWVVACTAIPGD